MSETFWLLSLHFKSFGSGDSDSEDSGSDSDNEVNSDEYHLFRTEMAAREYMKNNLARLPSGYTLVTLQPESS